VKDLDCNELVELVTAFLDHTLDPTEQRRVVDHLGLCDGCTAYVAQVRATIRSLSQLEPGPIDEAIREKLLNDFRKVFDESV
jgi:anti-sigma factor RsiW